MKSFILGKRGKRLIALCLVILQVLFQFPVEWKAEGSQAEGSQAEKVTKLDFSFVDHNSERAGSIKVEVELVVYKKIDAKKTEETDENVLSSSVMDKDKEEKVSASFFEDEGKEKTSSSTFGIEPDGNYTKEQVNWDESDGFKHYYPSSKYSEDKPSNKIHPTYGIVQKVLFYTGQTNQDGEISQEIPAEYMTKNYTIEIRVRGSNKSYETSGLYEERITDGNLPDDLYRTIELKLNQKKKKQWQGNLVFPPVNDVILKEGESNPIPLEAYYQKASEEEDVTVPQIEYYLANSRGDRTRIYDPTAFLVGTSGRYTIIARVPEDANHAFLEEARSLVVKKRFNGEIIINKNIKIPLKKGEEIQPEINEIFKAKVYYSIVSPKLNASIELDENRRIIRMRHIGKARIEARVDDWVDPKDGTIYTAEPEIIYITITPGNQNQFSFSLKDFGQPSEEERGGNKVFRYTVHYGKENQEGGRTLGKHSFRVSTRGATGTSVSYKLEAGEDIADFNAQTGVLTFKNSKVGPVLISATSVDPTGNYDPKTIYAEINVVYPDFSNFIDKQGKANDKGWYNTNIIFSPKSKNDSISDSDSWDDTKNKWKKSFSIEEKDGALEGRELFIKKPNGEIGKAYVLEKYNIDTTKPKLISISYRTDKESRVKTLAGYDFYKDTLEVELEARDERSGMAAICYRFDLQDSDGIVHQGNTLYKLTDNDERFSKPDDFRAIAKIKIDPQFRGKIVFFAVDNADNTNEDQPLKTDKYLVVDTIKPKGSFDFQPKGKKVNDHFYFQDKAFLTLNVEEKNFFPEDQDFSLKVYSRRNGEDKESSYRVQGNREALTLKKNSTFISDGRESLLKDNSTSFVQIMPNGEQNDLTMNFTQEGHYRLSFDYKDPSGNALEWKNTLGLEKNGELAITVDHTDPKIFFDPSSESGQVRYFAKDVKLKANVLEENFNPAATDLSYVFTPDRVEGRTAVASSSSLSSGTGERSIRPNNISWKKEKASDSTLNKAELSLSEDGKYVVNLHTTDFSGRTASASNILVVDKTPPKIRLTLSNDGLANEKYFREARRGKIEIEDAHLDFSSLQIDFSVKDKAGNPVSTARNHAAYLKNSESWTQEGNKYTCLVEFTEDGIYHLGLKVKDYAGNENAPIEVGETKAAFDFVVDRKAPTGALKIGDWDRSKDGTLWTKLLDRISFGRFSNKKQVIRLQAEDNLSGVGLVEVLRTREKMSLADLQASSAFKNVTGEVKDGYWSKEISPNETFITYVHLKDMAGNQYYLSSDGVILDQQNPEIHITLPKEEEKNGLYKKDVVVGISVTEPSPGNSYAGLKDVSYTVYRDGIETQAGSLYHFSKEEPQLNDLKKSYDDAHALTILAKDNNSNDVLLKIKAVDNAGNQTVKEERLSIDITKPRVTLSFDNNRVENEFYFKENRTATITVEERNFSQDAFKILITDPAGGKDGRLLEVERDSFQKVSGSGDSTRWESRIYFNKDGDYQLSITGEDLAGNAMEDLVYAEGTQAALDFTVDKTAPVLSVSYDNNTANHEFYYKEGRRAEISIEEKNFRSDLVDYSVLKDGGREGHGSALSSFSGGEGRGVSELHHQASISYEEDGDYQFNIRVKDLAGNEALAYPEDHFVIDRTAPSLTISDILNESANKGEVSPKISYGDRYLDQDALSLKLVGEVHGEHELSSQQGGSISIARTDALNLPMQKSMEETESQKQKQEEKEGIVYQSSAGGEEGNLSFQNFPEEPDTDDVYRLSAKIVDMAGNETTEELWFSVNRFGSTYLLSDRAKALQGTYQKEGEEILISEINADEVLSSALTLYRNEEKHALSEGAEYQTTRSGGNGKWYRGDYLIKKDNFDKEGLYHLQISSQDKAGNLASTEQTERGAELRFGIDRTPPRILLSNVDNQGVYRGDSLDLDLSVQDNLWLEQVDAIVDGTEELSWKDKSLQEAVAKDSFPLQISGEKGKRHKLLVVARDAAGNESRKEVSDFVITNNPLLRLISQKNFARNAAIATVAGLMGLSCLVNGPSLLQELKRRRLRGKIR
ncbi:hypothetical protein HNQ46_002359 [Oribacterium sinus]|uniref:DUF7743 domain-containing protein n=1 Tax=Oribacterium sinus TaxID=237576 RepID=A0A7W9SJ56_9FIRM|nr:Ig-like domain repeat protein [Oribacterium sinus]MBB6042360.1 hypothetical protein [Oribacterium sinus]